jgi:WhiB family redox-sensing transcriptional regulator
MPDLSRLPAPVAETWDWQLRAACRGHDSAEFFHPRNERRRRREQRESRAKEICARCPVLDHCREHALRVEESSGIWGGLTEAELRTLITQRRRARRR